MLLIIILDKCNNEEIPQEKIDLKGILDPKTTLRIKLNQNPSFSKPDPALSFFKFRIRPKHPDTQPWFKAVSRKLAFISTISIPEANYTSLQNNFTFSQRSSGVLSFTKSGHSVTSLTLIIWGGGGTS